MKRFLIAILFLLTASRAATAQRPSEMERVAAVRFALVNGFALPSGVTVARETVVDSGRPRPTPVRSQFREQDATALAAELPQPARTGSVANLITCHKRVCVPATAERVLVVTDPELTPQNRTVVGLTLYSRDNSGGNVITGAVVQLEKREGGWVGVSYSLAPFSGQPRIPP